MGKSHHFTIQLTWSGNRGEGTSSYTSYDRSHVLSSDGKEPLSCSSAPAFRGDGTLYNPEDMLLYSVSSCHMLWFLHCCADAGVVITAYKDCPQGTLVIEADGIGRFTDISLHPVVSLQDAAQAHLLSSLHDKAHQHCFIANSLSCPVNIHHSIAA